MDPHDFLSRTPPFDRLDLERARLVERSLEISYVPRGEAILRRTDPSNDILFVLRKGSVRLEREGRVLQILEDGDLFGYPSLLGGGSPTVDVFADEDCLIYRIPRHTFDQLVEVPGFGEYFLGELAARLRTSLSGASTVLTGSLAAPASTAVTRAPVMVGPGTSLIDAANLMTRERVSSVLVSSEPAGILTDRDLRRRVIGERAGLDAPLTEVMSQPLVTISSRATLLEALMVMLEKKIHHLPLVDEGRIVGVVTDSDLLRHQLKSPLHLLAMLERVRDPQSFSGFAAEMGAMVDVLFEANLEALHIGRIVASLNDAAARRLLQTSEQTLGAPPCDYAWIVFGSEGRMEQALLTDQDNALVFRGDGPEAIEYFQHLATLVVGGLEQLGIPRCPGEFMATRWNMPLAQWERQFSDWIRTPDERALIDAANFFDFRRVSGTLSLEPLETAIAEAGQHRLFLGRMAKNAVMFRPPLGLFRRIRERREGIDLKKGGIIPIVGIARLYALQMGIEARGTMDRLRAAAEAERGMSPEGSEVLSEAFRFLLHLRLNHQLQERREGKAVDNTVRLDDLDVLQRRHLKDVFVAIAEFQDSLVMRFGTNLLS